MDTMVLFQIAGVGILIAVINQILVKIGRDEQAMLLTITGLVLVLFWVVGYISELFTTIQALFIF